MNIKNVDTKVRKISLLIDIGSSDSRVYVLDDTVPIPTVKLFSDEPLVYRNAFYNILENGEYGVEGVELNADSSISEDVLKTVKYRDYSLFTDHLQENYSNSNSFVFKYKNQLYAHGLIVENEHISVAEKPSQMGVKSEFTTTYLSIQHALSRYALKYMQETGETPTSFEVSLFALLPPSVLDSNKADFIENVKKNITGIQVCYPIVNEDNYINPFIPVKFTEFVVKPEGGISIPRILYNTLPTADGSKVRLTVNSKMLPLYEGSWLLMDLGSSTLDVFLVSPKGSQNMNTRETFNIGFMRVLDLYANILTNICSCSPLTATDVVDSVPTCRKYLKNQMLDTSQALNLAKKKFAILVRDKLKAWLQSLGVNLDTLSGIVFIGGGALDSVGKDGKILSASACDYIYTEIKPIAKNLKVFKPDFNVRFANIDGLLVLYANERNLIGTV